MQGGLEQKKGQLLWGRCGIQTVKNLS